MLKLNTSVSYHLQNQLNLQTSSYAADILLLWCKMKHAAFRKHAVFDSFCLISSSIELLRSSKIAELSSSLQFKHCNVKCSNYVWVRFFLCNHKALISLNATQSFLEQNI